MENDKNKLEAKFVLCLLDILGFEALLKRLGLSALYEKYDILFKHMKKMAATYGSLGDWYYWKMKNVFFSDTLLFWTEYDELWCEYPMKLSNFIRMVNVALCFGIEIGLPLRGAIAFGDAILDSSLGVYLGQPLVEVARAERLQQWIGACLCPSILNRDYNLGLFPPTTVRPYKSHYKDTDNPLATGVALDWPKVWRESREIDPKEFVEKLNVDPKFSTYYHHTMTFIDFSETNKDWKEKKNILGYG